MNYADCCRSWKDFIRIYSSSGLSGLECYLNDFSGSDEEKEQLARTVGILRIRNSTGITNVNFLSAYDSLLELKNETNFLSVANILPEDTRTYLKAKIEEMDFNISRQEF